MLPFSLKNATRAQISILSSITIHFCTGVAPAAYRLDAFRKTYMKGDLIGTYVYLAFQKPFRESPSSGTSHSRSRGKLHDTARPSACGKATLLRMIAGLDVHGEVKQMGADACLLLWMVQNPITPHKSDSLVGGNSKRMTLTPLSSSCVGPDSRRVISPSLTTPNFSVRRRMMPFPPSKAAFSLALSAPHSVAIRGRSSCFLCEDTERIPRSSKPQVFSRKCAPASSLSSTSCSLGVTSTPFSHCTAPWRSSSSPTSSSSCPIPKSTSPPPDTWLPVPNQHFHARKKTPPCGRVFSFSGC